MNTVRAIRNGLERPTSVTYVLVFLASAAAVFVAVGHLSWIEASASYAQPPLQASHQNPPGALVRAASRAYSAPVAAPVVDALVEVGADGLSPSSVMGPAGAQTHILFRGLDGAATVSFPEVLVSQQATADGIVVSVPPLPQGRYDFTCGGALRGVLVVK